MNGSPTPTGLAAATKVVVDAVKTTFGAAVVVLFFFGLSLVILASGAGGLDGGVQAEIIKLLIYLMVAILVVLFFLRIFKPTGLSGPLQPETTNVIITNSKME